MMSLFVLFGETQGDRETRAKQGLPIILLPKRLHERFPIRIEEFLARGPAFRRTTNRWVPHPSRFFAKGGRHSDRTMSWFQRRTYCLMRRPMFGWLFFCITREVGAG